MLTRLDEVAGPEGVPRREDLDRRYPRARVDDDQAGQALPDGVFRVASEGDELLTGPDPLIGPKLDEGHLPGPDLAGPVAEEEDRTLRPVRFPLHGGESLVDALQNLVAGDRPEVWPTWMAPQAFSIRARPAAASSISILARPLW